MAEGNHHQGTGPAQAFMRSLGVKFFLLGALVLLLSIPIFAVWLLVQDRENNFRRATDEIGRQWGGVQTLSGPFLDVPVTLIEPAREDGEPARRISRRALVAPDSLAVEGNAPVESRKRGIHEAIVYQAAVAVRADFSLPDLASMSPQFSSADWSRARLVFAVSDLKGIESLTVKGNGTELGGAEPGLGADYGEFVSGFSVPVDLPEAFVRGAGTPFAVAIDLDLKGSRQIEFVPAGDRTSVSLASPWPHPSFSGAFLPQSRSIADTGFTADWSVTKLARQIPHLAFADTSTMTRYANHAFGVRFYQPVDFYKLVDRAVKYGVLFVSMAFLVIFVIEILSRGRMQMVHYAMTGMMVVVFYTLLLALAEFVGFTAAYAVASAATGLVISLFVSSVFPGRAWTVAAFAGFAGLYGFLYVVLQLAEAALLVGSVSGFVILSLLMFATRKLDWGARAATPPRVPDAPEEKVA